MTTPSAIGILKLRNATTGERSGTINIHRDEHGTIHMRIIRAGEAVVIRMRPQCALSVAELLASAADVPTQ